MIADTSIWVDYFRGKSGMDLDVFRARLSLGSVVMAPVVLSELLSSTQMTAAIESSLLQMEFATTSAHYWRDAGRLRRRLAKLGVSASLADCLIVQSCLEHGLPLLTRDDGIKKMGAKVGLVLV